MAETGLVRFTRGILVKDVYLVRGAPESVNSNTSGDRFGEYLVTRGFLRCPISSAPWLRCLAFGQAGRGPGRARLMRPLDVFRLLSQQVRERVMELFSWTEGEFQLLPWPAEPCGRVSARA